MESYVKITCNEYIRCTCGLRQDVEELLNSGRDDPFVCRLVAADEL